MIKTLSLWQPWATAMRDGEKLVETRSWSTKHRGPLAIHASKKIDRNAAGYISGKDYPIGVVLGIVDLVDVIEMTLTGIAEATPLEISWGDWRPGRFAWITRPRLWFIEPKPLVGHQGLFGWAAGTLLEDQLREAS